MQDDCLTWRAGSLLSLSCNSGAWEQGWALYWTLAMTEEAGTVMLLLLLLDCCCWLLFLVVH